MRATERTPPFALEEWIVDPEFHQISQGDVRCTIEPRVMSVLLQLAAHPQRVVSKDEFLQAVWPGTFVGEDALTRCISVLRHVLRRVTSGLGAHPGVRRQSQLGQEAQCPGASGPENLQDRNT
jgi:DNA-binding winged helix-turn-helix (wHTH) protein